MDADASSPSASVHSGVTESESNKSSISIWTSSTGDALKDSESTGEIITRFELDVLCTCEKLTNLSLLLMHVETKEKDYMAFAFDMDSVWVVKAEFDLLCGLLDSEVKELETRMNDLRNDKANLREFLSSGKHFEEPLTGMENMLHDSEKSLEQSLEQVLEIKERCAYFEKNLLKFFGNEAWRDEDYTESSNNDDLQELKDKMKKQTVEHQRHILRMLGKSLEKEMDLQKRVSELIQVEEARSMWLHSSEQEVHYAEVEAETTLKKFYEADNASELLMKTSKELLSEIKMLQFKLRGLVQQEADLKSSLQKLQERITEYEVQMVNEKASMEVIKEMENTIEDLKEQIIEAERQVRSFESISRSLIETSEELNITNEKVVLLEKELSDTNVRLQQTVACYEASQEDKNMFLLTIKDMGNVIDDLKKKYSQSVMQTESMEDKCIFLSESNADFEKELSSVRSRVKYLEASLHQTEEAKKATAKDISLHTKLITDLVMQMALERERLQKQISSLKRENKILVKSLKRTDGGPTVKASHGDKASSADRKLSNSDLTAMTGTEIIETSSTSSEAEKTSNETVTGPTDSASDHQVARNIGAWVLEPKTILLVFLILIVPLFMILNQTQVV